MSEIYMMVTICNRKQMQKFVKFYKQNHVDTGNISLAMGTAASDVLDYFGLEEDEKGIHFCLVTRPTWKTVKKGLQTELKIDVPGTGIVFLIPLSSIGGKHQLKFMLGEQEFEKGEETTLKETKHELIIAIANYGYNTQVMRAAEEGGATGGTVFHGKGVGILSGGRREESRQNAGFGAAKLCVLQILTELSQKIRRPAIESIRLACIIGMLGTHCPIKREELLRRAVRQRNGRIRWKNSVSKNHLRCWLQSSWC